MGVTRSIGKNTLGDNSKMQVHMHDYEMSSHDLSFVFRSSIAPGVLVPFMKLYAQKGDVFDISLSNKTLTHPTIGPLFGTFKLQHFVFSCPIRLYNSWLHNNKLGIGLKMSDIKLPEAFIYNNAEGIKELKTNSSSLVNYLGYKGHILDNETRFGLIKNAVPILAYYDIFKNYFANTQEEYFYMITKNDFSPTFVINTVNKQTFNVTGGRSIRYPTTTGTFAIKLPTYPEDSATLYSASNISNWNDFWSKIILTISDGGTLTATVNASDITNDASGRTITLNNLSAIPLNSTSLYIKWIKIPSEYEGIAMSSYKLEEIDQTRERILKTAGNEKFQLTDTPGEDYLRKGLVYSQTKPMGGLCVKTYDSDLFNNWVNTEYIDGTGGINEASAVTIQDGKLTMDALNLAQKVYNFLNRIAVSGGTYRDWLETAFTAGTYINRPETPMFEGGMTQLIQFDEVVSNSASTESGEYEPLGTLAGRGKDTQQKGSGKMHIKISEPSYLIGILAITPLVDYSQGNEWDLGIDTMDDWHKPALDGIGFEDSMNNQRAWWTGKISHEDTYTDDTAAGKTVAWINYMTNYNKTFGSFAAGESEDFMVLNREYERTTDNQIGDLTTYIDPTKYNRIFADTSLEAMNFWVQTACNITKRGNYSAKKIPNL